MRRRPELSVEQILAWADAHFARAGRWPTAASGPVAGVPGEHWRSINTALAEGYRGLPGESSLSRLLAEYRRGRSVPGDVPAGAAEGRGAAARPDAAGVDGDAG